jgi:glutaredoxin 3
MPADVVLYTTNYCPYCRAAKDFLRSKNVAFKEIDVTDDEALRAKLVTMSGQETVPQIFADGRPIGGYEELVAYYRSGKKL